MKKREFVKSLAYTLDGENIEYKNEITSNTERVDDYAKKQFEQNKKITMLKNKIQLLEKSLSQIVQDFEKEKELLKFQNEQIIKE
jgi:hypothetical protein